MKKINITKALIALILVMLLAGSSIAITACGKDGGSKSGKRSSKTEDDEDDEDDEDKDDKKDKDDKDDDGGNKPISDDDIIDDVFTGYSDNTIKLMAEQYEEMGYTVEPVTASFLGANDYNYVEGFIMYLEGQEEYYIGWAKFETEEDGEAFVKDVWIKNCTGFIDREMYGMYEYFVDGYFAGSVGYDGLMEFIPYEGDGRENTANPEDFSDPTVAAFCKEYQDKGFKVEADSVYDNSFRAYGVDSDKRHMIVECRAYADVDTAKETLDSYYDYLSTVEITYTDNSDGSVDVVIDGDEAYMIFPMTGTITADGVLIYTYAE